MRERAREQPGPRTPLRLQRVPRRAGTPVWLAPPVLLAALGILVLSSCERTPSKSDYVSARVTELCRGQEGDALRACRIAVIKQFQDTTLEEMQRRFPEPEPRARPSCGL